MTKQIQEPKPEKPETVNATLTVPLTARFHKVLQGLSAIVGLPIETILLDDLYSTLTGYFSGDFFQS